MRTINTVLIFLALSGSANAQTAAEISRLPTAAQTYRSPKGWTEKFVACKCIQNMRGECMSFGVPHVRQYDEYKEGPYCVSDCYPGFSDVYGYTYETKLELAGCSINWTRLRHEQGRDNWDGQPAPGWRW